MKTRLTVAIPLYNAEKYIEECVESILEQSLYDIKVIIIDDGSIDDSYSICKNIAKKDNRITLVHQKNLGCIAARRKAVSLCGTDYITFVDADDFVLKDAYVNALQYMNENIDMISFNIARYFDKDRRKFENLVPDEGYYDYESIKKLYHKLVWDLERVRPSIDPSLCTKIIKTSLYKSAYDESGASNLMYGQDTLIFCNIFLKIKSLQVINKCYYMHRQRSSGMIAPYILSNDYFKYLTELYYRLREITKGMDEEYGFEKQIDYFFMNSVNIRKQIYNDVDKGRCFLFPFSDVNKNSNIVLYGAGNVGKEFYEELMKTGYCANVLWVDKNAEYICDSRVKPINIIFENDYDYYVIAIDNDRITEQVSKMLVLNGVDQSKIINNIISL